MFKNQHFHCWGKRFDCWSGTRIPHAIWNRQENLEDNTGAKLKFGNEILGTTPKAQSMKENNKNGHKRVVINLFAGQEWRHRRRERACGHIGGSRQ